jgi:hypothetical protein
MGTRTHSGVARQPRSRTARLAALMLAGARPDHAIDRVKRIDCSLTIEHVL